MANKNAQAPREREFGESSKKDDERARIKRERNRAACEQVAAEAMDRIIADDGRPYRFHHAEACFLWFDPETKMTRYRLNVYVNGDESDSGFPATLIGESYAVKCDEKGILAMWKT